MKRVQTGEIEVEYTDAGSGERPLVLVHGFTGSRDDWTEVVPRLASERRVLAPDLRGHGGSTNTGDAAGYTLDQLARDLAAFMDAVGVERCDLLGHSLGGMVALRFALEAGERLHSLILMDTAPAAPAGALMERISLGAEIIRNHGMGTLCDGMRGIAAQDPHRAPANRRCEEEMGSDRYWERIRAKLLAMDPEAFVTLGRVLADHAPVTDRLGEIACPTLVIVGAEDAAFLAPAETLAAGLPRAEHVVVPDAAHSPQLENQAAWLAAIEAHLARVRTG
ncbi:MAG: alpha/beta fold hydrolase [Proteobacteria bacterium]|nr:alpha/beta fold hydrolase [Pseudomonadota bacterium]